MDTLREYTDVKQNKIQKRKTGSKDPNSNWAKARVLFAAQWKRAFELGFCSWVGRFFTNRVTPSITPETHASWVEIFQTGQTKTAFPVNFSCCGRPQKRIYTWKSQYSAIVWSSKQAGCLYFLWPLLQTE